MPDENYLRIYHFVVAKNTNKYFFIFIIIFNFFKLIVAYFADKVNGFI